MNDYGRPLRIFVMNLLFWGYRIWVEIDEAEVLHVQVPERTTMSPVLSTEIEKRARFLLQILRPFPPGPFEQFYGRLLSSDEKDQARAVAIRYGYMFKATPSDANEKWLVEISE
jgi:hypothetical protein